MNKQALFSLDLVVNALGIDLLDKWLSEEALQGFDNVETDSRKISEVSVALFVAIKGEKFDGHSFVESFFKAGGLAVLISDKNLALKLKKAKQSFFLVKDTLIAIRKIAARWRQTFSDIPVIAVAGSVGKTSTKDMLSQLLQKKYEKVLFTEASQNGFLGIALTLLKLRKEHQAAVIEIGIDAPGAMEQHAELVQATHAIMTKLGPEHLEQLKSVEKVVDEEMKLVQKLLQDGKMVFLNASDPLQLGWLHKTQLLNSNVSSQVRLFSLVNRESPTSDQTSICLHAFDVLYGEYSREDRRCEVYVNQRKDVKVFVFPEATPDHQVGNFLGVYRIAYELGLEDFTVEAFTRNLQASSKRGEFKILKQSGASLVGDYYNSSPEALKSGLRNVKADFDLKRMDQVSKEAKLSPSPRLFLALGDMLELGVEEKKYHKDMAEHVLATKADFVLLFGERMFWLYEELSHCTSMSQSIVVRHFEDKRKMIQYINENLRISDMIYLKASRSMKFEDIADALV